MDLNYLSADEMLGAFRRRELSPVEVLDSLIERVAKTSEVNAVAEEMFDEAHDVARAAEARYAGKGPAPRALEGVPVAVKEEMPIAGRSHRFGSLLTEGNVATQTQPMVQRLIEAGAVLHLRTTTPEFSIAVTTHSALWGVTRNPWNLDYSPGGSSGGSGAALAAGLAPLATGSDIAGSIRVPSALCGVVGFRPPYGRVPSLPPLSLDTYCQDGPMARTVTDCALFQNVISGPDPVDHVSVPAAPPLPVTFGSCAGLKVALAVTIGDFPVVPEAAANIERFANALRDAGAEVTPVEIPITRQSIMATAMAHYGLLLGPSVLEWAPADDPRWSRNVLDVVEACGAALENVGALGVVEEEGRMHAVLAEIYRDHDAIICPTMATTGYPADATSAESVELAEGVHFANLVSQCLTQLFNIASRHPVLNVPSGRADNGVPTGVQIVARPFDDLTAFRLGAAAEARLGLWNDPDWRPKPAHHG